MLRLLPCVLLLACGRPGSPSTGGETACADADADGHCDGSDACTGDDQSGDVDGDGLCDDVDPCPLSSPDDADADGVCDNEDLCEGDDSSGDSDVDGRCDDVDPCPQDAPDDTDDDGMCDSEDACPGSDDRLDADGDEVPDACDACEGSDDAQDDDGDGVPDGCDACEGVDDALDGDGDGQPDACDPCPEDHPDDADGDGLCDSTCRAWSEEPCGNLPWRGGGAGDVFETNACLEGWAAVGLRVYRSDVVGKVQLICREMLESNTLGKEDFFTGGWGSGGDGPFDYRCDEVQPSGVAVGQRVWSSSEVYGVGALCEDLGGGETWQVGEASVGEDLLSEDACPEDALVWTFDVRVDGGVLSALSFRCGVP